MQILVADDDPSIRKMLDRGLSLLGHEILEASNGKEALAVVTTHALDLVITDMFMPVMNGFEFLYELRSSGNGIPVIAISGGGRYMDQELFLSLAHKLGVACTLLKPFSLTEVDMALEAVTVQNTERNTNSVLRSCAGGSG